MNRRKFLVGSGAAIAATAAIDPLTAIAQSDNREIPGYGVSDANPKPLPTQSNDLSPYTGTWSDKQIQHLLRRAMFGVSYSQLVTARSMGSMDALVTKLLTDAPLPALSSSWTTTVLQPDRSITDPVERQKDLTNKDRFNRFCELSLQAWWMEQMVGEQLSIREKMTLMWSNHFVTGFDSVKSVGYMYGYNQMLRRNALGNLKTFVFEMSTDPAMLVYLNGNQNTYQVKNGKTINNINENFARELMELFTLGIYDPKNPDERNYSETDIQEAAKALSGWQQTITAPLVGQFISNLHNNENKTFFGQTGNWGLQDIINMIFAKNGGYNVAYFICQKIYTSFVYWVANPTVVDAMAQKLISSNWEIKPVLDDLLKSAHFYDENVIGAQLKSPAEFVFSIVREFGLTLPEYDSGEPINTGKTDGVGAIVYQDRNPSHSYLLSTMSKAFGQDLLNPPNVKGWAGAHAWVNTGTYPTRKGLAYLLLMYPNYFNGNASRAKGVKITFEPLPWAMEIPNANTMTSSEISNALSDAVLAFDLGPIESNTLKTVISNGLPDNDFYLDEGRVAQCAQVIATFPEFQLL